MADDIPKLTVVELDRTDLNDIPARLRGVADLIEAGERGDIQAGAGVFVNADGEVIVFGWGRTFDIHTIGLLQLGAAWLANRATTR